MERFVVIWLWWAWYTAWIYASRYGLNPLLIWESDGWLITENHMVENFPWYPNWASWYQIMEDIKNQAINSGARILQDTVKYIEPIDLNNLSSWYKIQTTFNGTIESKSILLAIWSKKVMLWVEWEKEFFWKWVSYCATCDWFFFRSKTVAVVWGWDSALIEALYLSWICTKVYLIHRRNEFRWEQLRLERLKAKANVEFITPSVITKIWWENKVEYIDVSVTQNCGLYNKDWDNENRKIELDWVFIAIWTLPKSIDRIDELLEKDEKWYIKVDEHMKTNLPWVFSAWDCSTGSGKFRQLITACSEWAIAAENAFKLSCHN